MRAVVDGMLAVNAAGDLSGVSGDLGAGWFDGGNGVSHCAIIERERRQIEESKDEFVPSQLLYESVQR